MAFIGLAVVLTSESVLAVAMDLHTQARPRLEEVPSAPQPCPRKENGNTTDLRRELKRHYLVGVGIGRFCC